jgi:hypothetical protein
MDLADELTDDDSHPIPKVGVIDYVRTIEGGGAAYALVIASPLPADDRSMHRLYKKIQAYVEDFASMESTEKRGTPAPGRMWILVSIHKDSSPLAFDVIRKHAPWILDNGIRLIVNAIDELGAVVQTISDSGQTTH